MARKIAVNVKVPVSILKEGKVYVAYSPVLDLSTSGKTFSQVRRRFSEAVQVFIEEIAEAGTIDEVLTDLGWRKVASRFTPPISVTNDLIDVRIPTVN